jgi:RHS repeat-associated protein
MEITDIYQNTVKSYDYDAFGNILGEDGSLAHNAFTYTGREYHPRSGLYYYRSRWYDPEIGRFITQDPIGFLGGTNLYAYVGNSPVVFIDPLGLCRRPDYYSFNINIAIPNPWTLTFIGWSPQITLDRNGNLYLSLLAVSIGKSLSGFSASLTGGWYGLEAHSADQLQGFLGGHSLNVAGGDWLGGGLTGWFGRGKAVEIGMFSPQVGGAYHYSEYVTTLERYNW